MQNLSSFRADAARFTGDSCIKGLKLLTKIASEPGLQCLLLIRLQALADAHQWRKLARCIHLMNLRLTGAEVGSPVNIGPGLVMKHPLGVVIGGSVEIGSDCTILGKVTLGELRPADPSDTARRYPRVGSRCLLGTGSSILGEVILGDDVKVGAHALVLDNVASSVTVVGSPARPINRKSAPVRSDAGS